MMSWQWFLNWNVMRDIKWPDTMAAPHHTLLLLSHLYVLQLNDWYNMAPKKPPTSFSVSIGCLLHLFRHSFTQSHNNKMPMNRCRWMPRKYQREKHIVNWAKLVNDWKLTQQHVAWRRFSGPPQSQRGYGDYFWRAPPAPRPRGRGAWGQWGPSLRHCPTETIILLFLSVSMTFIHQKHDKHDCLEMRLLNLKYNVRYTV